LGTKEGIKALTKLLRQSGAFSRTGKTLQPREQPKWEDERDPLPAGEEEAEEEDRG
jgi:hypothetical protein